MNSPEVSSPNLASIQQDLVADFQVHEEGFRNNYPWAWWLTLLAPFVITALVLSVTLIFKGPDFTWKLMVTSVVTFFFFGRFVILGGKSAGDEAAVDFLSSGELFVMVTFMDLAVASLLVFHLGVVFRLPKLGPKIAALVVDGHFILDRNPWMRKLTFVGLIMFVMFPLAATGSIGGCIFGRLLGMHRVTTFVGVVLGSLVGNGVMFVGSDFINTHFDKDHPAVMWGGLAIIVAVIVFLERRYARMKKNFVQEMQNAVPPIENGDDA